MVRRNKRGDGSTRARQTHVLFPDNAKRAFFLHHLKAVLPRGDGLNSDPWRGALSRFF
jgi:hypothetical protein